ncbi:MAG: type IV pilin protein [Rubrivivax sp.]|nr:type IV pilin protein [Rubrivivax sp.]
MSVKVRRHSAQSTLRLSQGFTLVELMIAVAIVAVLASVAYPAFQDSIRKGRRAEAFTALSALQQAQERWRSNNATYTTTLANTAASNAAPNGLNIPATSSSGLYTIGVTVDSGTASTTYIATATANSGSSQANDGNCKVLGVQMAGGTLRYGSGATAITWSAANPDAGKCWAR